MPTRAETIVGYVEGMHVTWLTSKVREAGQGGALSGPASVEIRYRYNPDVKSIVAMVPAVIPMLLILIPAMLAAVSVVREKELGLITNFYVTPTTRLEFLLGKQVPYVLLSFFSFLLLTLFAVTTFGVPLKGSFLALAVGAGLYVAAATAFGLLMSSFMRSQIGAIFGTALLSILPALSTHRDVIGRLIGEVFPTTYFLIIARGTFSKALGFEDLWLAFWPLMLTGPVLVILSALLLKKQEV